MIDPIIEAFISDLVRIADWSANAFYRRLTARNIGLVYHPHHRPLTTPIAALLDLSATLHSQIPSDVPFPTPSRILLSLGAAFPPSSSETAPTSPLDSMANALTIPPI